MSLLATVIVVAALLWFSLALAWLYLLAAPTRRSRTRVTRRGGYEKLRVSPTTSPEEISRQLAQATSGFISSHSPLGIQWVDGVTLAVRLGTSRPTAPGLYGNATAEAGANGQPPLSAACFHRAEHRRPTEADER